MPATVPSGDFANSIASSYGTDNLNIAFSESYSFTSQTYSSSGGGEVDGETASVYAYEP